MVDRDQDRVVTGTGRALAAISKRFLFAFLDCAFRNSTFDADLKPGNPLSVVITIQAI